MADIPLDARTFLIANAGLTALIGTRIYPSVLPQTPTLPAVVYQTISDVREMLHDGPQGLPVARIQYDCWGVSYTSARNTANALRTAADGYRGAMGASAVGFASVLNMIDTYEPVTQRYRTLVDVLIQRSE